MNKIALLLLGCGFLVGCSSSATYLETRKPAPALSAPNHYGKMVSMKEATSGPWALVFFYPQADTPG